MDNTNHEENNYVFEELEDLLISYVNRDIYNHSKQLYIEKTMYILEPSEGFDPEESDELAEVVGNLMHLWLPMFTHLFSTQMYLRERDELIKAIESIVIQYYDNLNDKIDKKK